MSGHSACRRPLAGQLILLVEDDALASSVTEAVLRAAGAKVLLAHGVYQATLIASRHELTAAILDSQLGQTTVESIGAYLAERGIPFALLLNRRTSPPRGWEHVTRLYKPADTRALAMALAAMIGHSRIERRRRRS